jgi:hypothetical protein
MQFIVNLLRIGPNSESSVQWFLMLTHVPADRSLERRCPVEGVHVGYQTDNALIDAFRRAELSEESVGQLIKVRDQKSSLVCFGVLTLDSRQLRTMGFETLARVIDDPRICQTGFPKSTPKG